MKAKQKNPTPAETGHRTRSRISKTTKPAAWLDYSMTAETKGRRVTVKLEAVSSEGRDLFDWITKNTVGFKAANEVGEVGRDNKAANAAAKDLEDQLDEARINKHLYCVYADACNDYSTTIGQATYRQGFADGIRLILQAAMHGR